MVDLSPAREAQRQHHWKEAERLGVLVVDGLKRIKNWTYRAPTSDDLDQWRGITKWVGIEQSYRWQICRETDLKRGLGPFWCPQCQEKPAKGWRAQLCYDCSWINYLADECLEKARGLSRDWHASGQAAAAKVVA